MAAVFWILSKLLKLLFLNFWYVIAFRRCTQSKCSKITIYNTSDLVKTQVSQLEKGNLHCFCQGLEYEIEFSIIIRHFTIWRPSFHEANTILFEDMSNEWTKLMAYFFKTYRTILIQDFMGLTTGRVVWTFMTNKNAPFAALYKKIYNVSWDKNYSPGGRVLYCSYIRQLLSGYHWLTDSHTSKTNRCTIHKQLETDWLQAEGRNSI